MALLKPPGIGREKPWHQDHAYFNVAASQRIVGVWIALDAATPDNGCMYVLRGKHRDTASPNAYPHFAVRDYQICDTTVLDPALQSRARAVRVAENAPAHVGGRLCCEL